LLSDFVKCWVFFFSFVPKFYFPLPQYMLSGRSPFPPHPTTPPPPPRHISRLTALPISLRRFPTCTFAFSPDPGLLEIRQWEAPPLPPSFPLTPRDLTPRNTLAFPLTPPPPPDWGNVPAFTVCFSGSPSFFIGQKRDAPLPAITQSALSFFLPPVLFLRLRSILF